MFKEIGYAVLEMAQISHMLLLITGIISTCFLWLLQ